MKDEMKDTGNVVCHCGSPAHLRPNELLYGGRSYGNGYAYICDRFPVCRGSVGVHPNGKPLGTIPTEETKMLRRQLHARIDPLWRNQARGKKKARGSVYGWLQKIMNLSPLDCHVGKFDADMCKRALKEIDRQPYEQHAPLKKPFLPGEF
jgi:hypothetical protein